MKTIGLILLTIGGLLTIDPAAPPQVAAAQEPLAAISDLRIKGMSDADHLSLFKIIDARHEARLQSLAKEIEAYDPMNPPKAVADNKGFILAGTAIAAAIAWIVKKIITAILWSIMIALILTWFKSYWWAPLVALLVYILSTAGIARAVQRRA